MHLLPMSSNINFMIQEENTSNIDGMKNNDMNPDVEEEHSSTMDRTINNDMIPGIQY